MKNTFLNEELGEEVYIDLSLDFKNLYDSNTMCKKISLWSQVINMHIVWEAYNVGTQSWLYSNSLEPYNVLQIELRSLPMPIG